MKRVLACLAVLALSAFVATSSFADDEPKKKKKGGEGGKGKGNPVLTQAMKALEAANLTDEQKGKVKELAAKMMEETKALAGEGLTAELTKKRGELMKAAREAGKKGKDLAAAANEGLSEAELAVVKKETQIQGKFRKAVLALLTDEQKAALPETMIKTWSGPEKGKGGKKKEAA